MSVMSGMQVVEAERGRVLVLAGELDASTVADVRLALHDAIDAGWGDLVVNLAGLTLVDATGLGCLVGAHRRASRLGRRLVLRDVPPRVDRMLLMTRLHRILHVQGRLPAA